MYQSVSPNVNFVEQEKKIEAFWEEEHIFEKSIDSRKKGTPYVFYDGPPTANGKPHIGHVLTRVIKDMIPRYRTMKGYMVPRKAGWDTHGLPVELEVEKTAGAGRQGADRAVRPGALHRATARKASGSTRACGRISPTPWASGRIWITPTSPMTTTIIESEWWALKTIWEKGLLYKGFKIVPYCPRCGTPLSSHEVAQGYKDVKERSAIAVQGQRARMPTSWPGPPPPGLCPPTWRCVSTPTRSM